MRETLVKSEEFKDSPVGKIPNDWEVVKLESLLNGRPKNGYSPKEVNEWTGTLMLGLGCLTEEGFEPCQLKNAPSNDLKIRAALLSDGDFLLSRSNTRERVALAAIYRDVGVPCIYSDLMMRLSLNEKICSRFMELLLRHSPVRRQLTGNAQGTSGSMVKISSQTVMETVVLLPPRKEQDRIISVMDTLEQAIAHTSSLIAKLKQMKAGLLHDLLTRGLDENGELRDAIAHPEQFKHSPLGRIPREWEVRTMEEITTKIVDGVHKTPVYVESGIPFLTVENLTAGIGISLKNVRYVTPSAHAEFFKRADPKPGDVLVSKDGTLGIARIVSDDLPEFSIFVSVAQLRPNEALVLPSFICTFFETGEYERQLGHRSSGTGLKHIHLEHFRAFQLAVPPIAEQHRISKVLNCHDIRIRKEEAYRDKLKLQKQGLMHDLLTGKVRVKNA